MISPKNSVDLTSLHKNGIEMNCPGILPSAQQQGDSAPPREPHGDGARVVPPRPCLRRCSAFRLRLLCVAGVGIWPRSPHRRATFSLTPPFTPCMLSLPHFGGRRPPNRRHAAGCSRFGGLEGKVMRSPAPGNSFEMGGNGSGEGETNCKDPRPL